MSNYDDYITGMDKPFAENINDALLLSNVFDLTVPIQAPTMFKNGAWIDTVSRRKCGVAILTLKEQLPSGVSISTVDGKSVLTGTGTVKLGFYPNFNSFGRFKSISWENTGTVQINLKTNTGTTIVSNISKGQIENSSNELRKLQEIVIEIVLNNSTLKTLDVVMVNKQQTRYGAEVGISDVTGLDDTISAIQSIDSAQDGRLDLVEAKDVAQDGRLTSIESKDIQQDSRLDGLESDVEDYVDVVLTANKHIVKSAETFTITAKATHHDGTPYANKQLVLREDSRGVTSSATTNTNGIATFTSQIVYLETNGGVVNFTCENASLSMLVPSFVEEKSHSSGHYTLYVDKVRRICRLNIQFSNASVTGGSLSEYEVTSFVPSTYLPRNNIISPLTRDGKIYLYLWGSGGTVGVSNSTSTSYSLTCDVQIEWAY